MFFVDKLLPDLLLLVNRIKDRQIQGWISSKFLLSAGKELLKTDI